MKKIIIAIVILGALGGAGYYFKDSLPMGNGKQEVSAYPVVKVTRRDIDRSVDVSGFVEPLIATEVKSEVSGKILEIKVENGDMVKGPKLGKDGKQEAPGEILVVLDKKLTEAELEEAQQSLQMQKISLEKAKRDHTRYKKLYADGFATEKDWLDAETAEKNAEVSLAVQQSRVDKAQENYDKTTILAPHDGMVTNLDVNVGQVVVGAGSVNSGTTLMKVNNLSQLIVQANLNEFDVAKIQESTPAVLTFDSLPDIKVTGKLFFISPSGLSTSSSTTASLSTALRVFPIKVSFSSEGHSIRPGISANISMIIASVKNALAVPVSAVFIEGNDRCVYVEQSNKTYKRQVVKTGINNDGYIEITEGISEGDTVSLIRPPKEDRK
ncbi:MAG: efflux RND transporter periplasmic adaptor subunit [Puniceicoccales bacterium]|jgi:HlyD family secretion protein|nr:efflux RND transporter periplasmic adaptor subunit [Puniceicoccales bacterium]